MTFEHVNFKENFLKSNSHDARGERSVFSSSSGPSPSTSSISGERPVFTTSTTASTPFWGCGSVVGVSTLLPEEGGGVVSPLSVMVGGAPGADSAFSGESCDSAAFKEDIL